MDARALVLGIAFLASGAFLAAAGAERAATAAHHDPVAGTATGDVHVVGRGDDVLRLPVEMHRGATYPVYDRTFALVRLPADVVEVDFGVYFAAGVPGSPPYPFSADELPASQSWSGAHVEESPWKPPFGEGVVAAEARHTFRTEGEEWRARLALDTGELPPGEAFDYVVGSWYVARRADVSATDVQGITGAGVDHTFGVREGDASGRAVQAAGLPLGAALAAAGLALAVWGARRRR